MNKIFITSTLIFLHHSFLIGGNGLTAEITDLNAVDISFQKEKELPYLQHPFINSSPADKKDQLSVGRLGIDGGNKNLILKYAHELADLSENPKTGQTDSLLIAYQGKLIFESYFRRGRINYPHYQMSITKSYTAYAIGRAIQLGHLSMEDLHRPVTTFLDEVKPNQLAKGANSITLHQAMQMSSGIRLPQKKINAIIKKPNILKGQGQAQAYLQFTQPIQTGDRNFKYQAADPVLTMQVLHAVVPGSAEQFIQKELLTPLGISNYGWQEDLSGYPKSAAGSSFLSRDMIKMGILTLNNGVWNGKQHLPEKFVKLANSPLTKSYGDNNYGYFWWSQVLEIEGHKYPVSQGRGAGGQFIFMFPTLELVVVATAHNKGMGKMLNELPKSIIPAFVE